MAEMTLGALMDAAKNAGFEPLPVGTYNARVDGNKTTVKQGKTCKQILLRLVVVDGPMANRSILNNMSPLKNDGDVNGMFYQQMSALGFGPENPIMAQAAQMDLDQAIDYIAPQLDGAMVIIDVDHQKWNDEKRDNVKRMKPYTGGVGAGPLPSTVAGPVPGVQQGAPPQPPTPAAPAPTPTPAPAQPAPAPAPMPEASTGGVQAAPTPQATTPPVTTAPMPQAQPVPVQPDEEETQSAPAAVPTPPPPTTDLPSPF